MRCWLSATKLLAEQGDPVVYVDRDGVINRLRADSVKSWDEFELLPGALAGLAKLHANRFRVVVVTNQANVGRGVLSPEVLDQIHRNMVATVGAAGGRISAVEVCPHRPEHRCSCRKPAPGLLLRAARAFNYPRSKSHFIGDDRKDVLAAHAAGMRSVLVLSGHETWPLPDASPVPDLVARDLLAAVDLILGDTSLCVQAGE